MIRRKARGVSKIRRKERTAKIRRKERSSI
jgi:hypothetical protein